MHDIPELQLAVTERRPAWGARVLVYDSSATGIHPAGGVRKQGKKKEEGFSKLLSLELRSVRIDSVSMCESNLDARKKTRRLVGLPVFSRYGSLHRCLAFIQNPAYSEIDSGGYKAREVAMRHLS